MEKPNFQRVTEKAIERLCVVSRPPLLLHACCAPCSSYVLEYLTQYFSITLFFCNPNITDPAEYQKRLAELRRFCAEAPFCRDVTVVEDSISSEAFLRAAAGLEDAPEGGSRCERCFRLRLERAAAYAQEKGFPLFATTLTVSPHKNAPLLNAIGQELGKRYGVEYLPSDFKKKGGYQRSIALSREYGLYRQPYCGCGVFPPAGRVGGPLIQNPQRNKARKKRRRKASFLQTAEVFRNRRRDRKGAGVG